VSEREVKSSERVKARKAKKKEKNSEEPKKNE
jgi:hypothetical protein